MGAAGLAIVGGGPAGCAAAAAARAAGMDVVLYDGGPSPRMRPVESLPPGTAELVDEIFGPGAFRPDDHLPAYANRSRWGSDELETADFVFNPFGHGWHVRRPAFDAALLDAVRRWACASSNERLTRGSRGRVRHRRERPLGADRPRPRRAADARRPARRRLPRDRRARARPPRSSRRRTGGRTTSPGITAFLTDADLLPRLPGCVTDASTSWLDRIAGPGWAATGDAAAAFDPLSSQGIVTALVMGREAGRVAAGTVSRGGVRGAVRVTAGGAPGAARGVLRARAALGRRRLLEAEAEPERVQHLGRRRRLGDGDRQPALRSESRRTCARTAASRETGW